MVNTTISCSDVRHLEEKWEMKEGCSCMRICGTDGLVASFAMKMSEGPDVRETQSELRR